MSSSNFDPWWYYMMGQASGARGAGSSRPHKKSITQKRSSLHTTSQRTASATTAQELASPANRQRLAAQRSASGVGIWLVIFWAFLTAILSVVIYIVATMFGGLDFWLCMVISGIFSFWLCSLFVR